MDTTIQGFYLNIPKADVKFFRQLAKMGWSASTKESMLDRYVKSRLKDVELSDDDILSELNAVRYSK